MTSSTVLGSTQKKAATFASDSLLSLASQASHHFRRITRAYAFFNITYFLAFAFELFGLLLFFSFFMRSSIVAFTLATLFLTGFSYFVLRFYLQGRKPQQIEQLRQEFEASCEKCFPKDLPPTERRRGITGALHAFIAELEGQEYQYYPLPSWLSSLQPLLQKFSLWCHWQDVLDTKELLFRTSLRLQMENIKSDPTSIDVHTMLARTYIDLYHLYQSPQVFATKDQTKVLTEKFHAAAHRALEELKIINTFSPDELWVQAQFVSVYGDLGKKEKEIEHCETLARLAPQDREVLFRLGVLYFSQGKMAHGLKIYEQLKKGRDPKADELLMHYIHR
ncbi:MAG: hypothetical protein JSR58_01275 [Verrucomicrobia bacterium]|nr:hypothetical protein [Verrucomicrobiota bacterium]